MYNEESKVSTMPDTFVASITNIDVLKQSEVSYTPKPVDKIRVVLYKNGKMFDSFSFGTKPKSRLIKTLVSLISKVVTLRNKKRV